MSVNNDSRSPFAPKNDALRAPLPSTLNDRELPSDTRELGSWPAALLIEKVVVPDTGLAGIASIVYVEFALNVRAVDVKLVEDGVAR